MFSRFFINRPIFASVLSIVITLGGIIAFTHLPVAQYPEITPPTVEVSAVYPGANARVVADTVAAPIEQQVNGVENMMYMSSQCTNDGKYTLTVIRSSGERLRVLTPACRTTAGSCGMASASRFCTSTCAILRSTPLANVTVNAYVPSFVHCDDM